MTDLLASEEKKPFGIQNVHFSEWSMHERKYTSVGVDFGEERCTSPSTTKTITRERIWRALSTTATGRRTEPEVHGAARLVYPRLQSLATQAKRKKLHSEVFSQGGPLLPHQGRFCLGLPRGCFHASSVALKCSLNAFSSNSLCFRTKYRRRLAEGNTLQRTNSKSERFPVFFPPSQKNRPKGPPRSKRRMFFFPFEVSRTNS